MNSVISKLKTYCTEKNHPYIQIFYFGIGPFLYLLCWLFVLFPKKSIIGIFYSTVCNILAGLGFINYVYAWLKNPGIITKENEKEFIQKTAKFYDGIAFKNNNKCETCNLTKLFN